MATKYTKETYLYWYELMQLIRQFELMAEEKYKMEGKIRGFFHAYVGQEAIAAGCMTATRPEDLFITAYRDHGLAIAKGISVNSCMAELYGKATGCAKGKGGSMHFFGKKENFYGGHGIVGAQIGTGAGLAIYKLADAYEMPADVIDGMSAEAVHEGVARAVKRAREGDGPTLLEIKTYRYKGHSISDPQKYRTKEEVEEYKGRDPIHALLNTMYENKLVTEEEIKAINERVDAAVAESVKFAEESPWPDDSEVLKDIYVDQNYPFITD
ncbi:MAG: pyruvate dehydrogenase (acetyl-transferring) E1 component subunit alpha [Chitinophagaceae bacterium]|nr:MAG: pyruvate dehydrogenase (acetyl-transferring) E1 component subunit alpha [Chitinophagaceae bacterium]